MYSAYKLNKQGGNIQPWRTPLPIWNQSVVPCPVLTVASWPAYRFLKRQIRWSGMPISFRISHSLLIYTVKGLGIVKKAEIDVFLELSCFFNDPADVGNLISGSSAFSKTSKVERLYKIACLERERKKRKRGQGAPCIRCKREEAIQEVNPTAVPCESEMSYSTKSFLSLWLTKSW